jgi:hypothetical protein
LEEVTPPAGVVDQVLAGLPAQVASPTGQPEIAQQGKLGPLLLAGQMAVGLALVLFLLPISSPTFDTPNLRLPWLTLIDMVLSLTNWLADLAANLNYWLQVGSQTAQAARFNLSPELTTGLIAGLSLAWLIGNAMLLPRKPFTSKNGGAL